MSDDFGTVNARRGERAREIEILRQHYRRHQEALQRMTEDAPTERLAVEYERLLGEIDAALVKLDDLEGKGRRERSAAPPAPPLVTPAVREQVSRPMAGRHPEDVERPHGDPLSARSEPGMRPLVAAPGGPHDDAGEETMIDYTEGGEERRSRVALIVVVGILALAVIGWLIWRASSERGPAVEETTTVPVVDTQPVAPVELLVVTPETQNYGVIRKGTRATRQFEIANTSDEPVSIQLARSACRCLYYEYAETIPPSGRESVTVTIDGARAPAGELRESVAINVKGDPATTATLEVEARIE